MSQQQSSYRSIFKATSIFGGVQVFNILITLIRAKFVAILIGATGMGLNGLYFSLINLIKSISNLGLDFSAIRELSDAVSKDNEDEINRTYSIIRVWIWISAILSMLITIMFAPFLSQYAFGNKKYTSSVLWLSLTFLFTALSGGVFLVLRALRRTKELAKANILGSAMGLLFSLPILYFYRMDGIVPSIIFASFVSFVVSMYFKKYIKLKFIKTSLKDAVIAGKPMITQGIYVSISAYFNTLNVFLLSMFITSYGSVADLGLYNAGMSIMAGVIGVLFSAIATDYFPRLAKVINTEHEWKDVVNHQAELLLIILPMLLMTVVLFSNFIIDLLLSKEFRVINLFLMVSTFAIPLKGITWVTGFIFSAKRSNKVMILTELLGNSLMLVFGILFYMKFSFLGLAFSTILTYILCSIINLLIVRKQGFHLSQSVKMLLVINIVVLSLLTSMKLYLNGYMFYILSTVTFLITSAYLLKQLNNKIDFISFIKHRK